MLKHLLPALVRLMPGILLLSGPLAATAQRSVSPVKSPPPTTYQVALGSAGQYGLLSGGTLTAQNQVSNLPDALVASSGSAVDIPIRVLGKAGANQSIGSLVTATQGLYASGSGTVPQALADLQSAKNYCAGLSGRALSAQLAGQALTQGVYTLAAANESSSSDATLSAGSVLTISGDTATVVILNIAGNLTLAAGSQVVLRGVLPRHVYWNIGGSLSVGSGASFMGVALVSGTALVDGIHFGGCTILSGDDIVLTHISETVGHSKFFASLGTDSFCSSNACTSFTPPGSELILDGSFELKKCCPVGFSELDEFQNTESKACYWKSATQGSSDYYNVCATYPYASIPNNILTLVNGSSNFPVPALAQNSRTTNGQGYAGIYAYQTVSNQQYREYIGQEFTKGPLQKGKRYYGEFSAHIAPSSGYTVPQLGMVVASYGTIDYPDGSKNSGIIPLMPTVAGNPNLPLASGATTVTPGWQRVGQVFTSTEDMIYATVVIGNFNGTARTQNGPSQSGSDDNTKGAYYFIDNVTLSPLTEAAGSVLTLNSSCATAGVKLGTTPMPAVVAATYQWTSTDPNLTGAAAQMPNPIVSPTQTTTYTLAVTINGQVYTSQATVTVTSPSYGQNAAATYVAPAGTAAYELGKPQSHPITVQEYTVIGASQAPYGAATNNTVTFDGIYHVKGNLRLTNGTFILNPGTAFYIDGYGHSTQDVERIVISVNNGELHLNGAALQATCDEMWGGLEAGQQGSIYTASSGTQRTVIRDAQFAINRLIDYFSSSSSTTQNSHLYLANTDFLNNDVAILDGLRIGTYAQPDYIRSCSFRTDQTASPLSLESYTFGGVSGPYGSGLYNCIGIAFYDYWEHYGGSGSATPLQITNCTFDRLQVGIFGTSNNVLIQTNTFNNCWYAAAYSQFSTWSSGGQGPNSPATRPVVNFLGNMVILPTLLPAGYSTTPNLPVYGVRAQEGFVIQNNQFNRDAQAVGGVIAQTVGISLTNSGTATDNTLTVLNTGIEAKSGDTVLGTDYVFSKNAFRDLQQGIVFSPHPTTYDYGLNYPFNVAIRCNTFSSSLTNALGVWVQQNTRFVGQLGSSGTPNGNSFSGLGSVPANYFRYDNNNVPSQLRYVSYASSQEYTSDRTVGNVIVAVSAVSANGACGGGNGVNIKSGSPTSESVTTTGAVGRTVQEQAAPASISSHLNEAAERQQSLAYEQVLLHQRVAPVRGGLPTLAVADRQTLRQIATSGSLAARSACQLLQFYEPNCQCSIATAAARPTQAPLQVAAQTKLMPGLGEGHPNPASETVTLAYHLPSGARTARLVLRDLTGRQVSIQTLTGEEGETVLAVHDLAAGLYIGTLEVDGHLIGTRKLAVMH